MARKKRPTTDAASKPRKRRIDVGERLARSVSRFTASTTAFLLAVGVVAAWLITGPLFGFSDTWQLVINTGTTIVTFLMVFLIQRTQDKESLAVQLKLNELIAALEGASNRMVDIESLAETDLDTLHRHYATLAAMAQAEGDIHCSHSVDEAEKRHNEKKSRRG